jgi:hypothetical protein
MLAEIKGVSQHFQEFKTFDYVGYINLTVKLNCRAASLDRGSARGRTTIVKAASNLAQDSPASSGGML